MTTSSTMSVPNKENDPDNSKKLRPRPPPPDISVLRPSIEISLTGMRQALKALENGTSEIRSTILNECNVIYECKTCFNMFRSLANLISHKRSFCTARIQDVKHIHRDFDGNTRLTTAYVQPEEVDTIVPEKEWDLEEYSPSLSLLKEAGFIQEIQSVPSVKNLKPPMKKGLDSIVRTLRDRAHEGVEKEYFERKTQMLENLVLEPLKQTDQAVFQTYNHETNQQTMGQKYIELQRLKQHPSVLMGPDGKIIDPGKPPGKFVNVSPSNSDSSTKENAETRYPCPICKKHFGKVFSVFRHIIHGHGKTMEEAKQMDKRIKKMSFVKDNETKNICRTCQKSFSTSQGLSNHSRYCKTKKIESLISILNNQPVVKLVRMDLNPRRSTTPLSTASSVMTNNNVDIFEDDEISFENPAKKIKLEVIEDSSCNINKRTSRKRTIFQ